MSSINRSGCDFSFFPHVAQASGLCGQKAQPRRLCYEEEGRQKPIPPVPCGMPAEPIEYSNGPFSGGSVVAALEIPPICVVIARTRHKMVQMEVQEAARRGAQLIEV